MSIALTKKEIEALQNTPKPKGIGTDLLVLILTTLLWFIIIGALILVSGIVIKGLLWLF